MLTVQEEEDRGDGDSFFFCFLIHRGAEKAASCASMSPISLKTVTCTIHTWAQTDFTSRLNLYVLKS